MKNQPFIIPLAGLVLGILFTNYFSELFVNRSLFWILGLIGIASFCSLYFKQYSSFIFCIFLSLGSFLTYSYNDLEKLPEAILKKDVIVKLEILDVYKPSAKFRKYKVRIWAIDSINHSTNALLYWKKENPEIFPQDIIWTKSQISHTQKPLNPHQFDYAKYLKKQRIEYVVFSDTVFWKEKEGNSISHATTKFKRKIHQNLLKSGYSKSSTDLIGAMLLGDRTEMDRDVEDNYRKTGVVHILSISGLHVMMVYSFFYLLLYPVTNLSNGKKIRILLSLVLIWSYVVLVGFQPPVLRSAVMITVYCVALSFRRTPNVYHTLAVSALLLLLWNPNFLFDVGFQLSFSAVFFIVYLHPIYRKLFRPKSKFAEVSVGFIGTSISAQLGTFPFTALYFNQTSGLFLAGNLVMIFASYVMMMGGIISIVLLELNLSISIWVKSFNAFIHYCNSYIQWLSSFDFLVFDSLHFVIFESLLLILCVFLIRIIFFQPKFKWILLLFGILLIFQLINFYNSFTLQNKNELIVFHQPRNTVIGVRNGPNLVIYVKNISDTSNLNNYILKPYKIKEEIKYEKFKPLKAGDILILPSKYVLIQNNIQPQINNLSPKTIFIIDGSNYPNFKFETQIPIWKTHEKGAKIIELR